MLPQGSSLHQALTAEQEKAEERRRETELDDVLNHWKG